MSAQATPLSHLRTLSRLFTAAWVFGVIGPLVGYALILIVAAILSPLTAPAILATFFLSFLLIVPLVLVYSAFWPALLTGVVAGFLSLVRARPAIYYPVVTVSGALFTQEWFSRFPEGSFPHGQDPTWTFVGAASATVCAWMLRRLTPAAERA